MSAFVRANSPAISIALLSYALAASSGARKVPKQRVLPSTRIEATQLSPCFHTPLNPDVLLLGRREYGLRPALSVDS